MAANGFRGWMNARNLNIAVLMITHDPEEVRKYADCNIHLVRNQDSPWRCFNVHESDNGQEVSHA